MIKELYIDEIIPIQNGTTFLKVFVAYRMIPLNKNWGLHLKFCVTVDRR